MSGFVKQQFESTLLELTYAIAQDTYATRLHHGNDSSTKTTQVNNSDFRGMYAYCSNKFVVTRSAM